MKFIFIFSLIVPVIFSQTGSDDHQTKTYNGAQFSGGYFSGNATIIPYFSPWTSVSETVNLIESAVSTLDIGTPGWKSWIGCSQYGNQDGCDVNTMRNKEQFPVQAAVLNAAFRGVRVRILTNDYEVTSLPGMIDPLQLLAMASPNISLKYYTSTSFYHAKYLAVDGKVVSISSVNFSYTSLMENREAGITFIGNGGEGVLTFAKSVFDFDFNNGYPHVPNQSYNASDMAIITSTVPIPVPPCPKPNVRGYIPPVTPVASTATVEIFTSPDYAREQLMASVNSTKSTFQLFIYQVTDVDLCLSLLSLSKNNIKVQLLVSRKIYSDNDYKAAQACYKVLYDGGMTVRETNYDFTYSHQKYWIVDGERMWLSTGNWSPTDYPVEPPTSFPPPGSPGWRQTNRDYTVAISNSPYVITQFNAVMQKDYATGANWHPYN